MTIFEKFGNIFSINNSDAPLKNHPQFAFILDSLSRYHHRPVALISKLSDKIHRAFAEGLAQYSLEEKSKTLKNCDFIFFDATCFSASNITTKQIEQDFSAFTQKLNSENKRAVLIVNNLNSLEKNFLAKFLAHDEWRILGFISEKTPAFEVQFTMTYFIEPHASDLLALLKNHCAVLEKFHQVTISDDAINSAYTMAAHYLPGFSLFDKTLELLDAASARATDVVTDNVLTQIIANYTHIPLTHLQNNKFQALKFLDAMKKHIHGQDAAMGLMASLLQNACIKLQDTDGPLCNFLFVGAHDTGKTATTYAIAEHLFGHRDAVLFIDPNQPECDSFNKIKIFPRKNDTHLLPAIQQTPYAIILIENIEQFPENTRNLLKTILEQKKIVDEQNNSYDFSHSIVIATTRIGSEYIAQAATHRPAENAKTVDLMQLVLNQNTYDSAIHGAHLSPQELCETLRPKLIECFSETLLQNFNLIPFVSLDYSAFEKIIRAKIKILAKHLQTRFGIELSAAPEVIKFLAHEALWQKTGTNSLDTLLKQHLYSVVTHEILLHAENKERSKRLLIQLNESGLLLHVTVIASLA